MSVFGGYVANFFAGAFLCNCLPHLVAGLQGQPFPTPFAKPRGVGRSSPLVNVVWGMFNLVAGCMLLLNFPIVLGVNAGTGLMVCGALCLGTYLAVHFGRVNSGTANRR